MELGLFKREPNMMDNIATFENFQPEGKTEKYTLSASNMMLKSDWFGRLTSDKKKLVKKLAGKEIAEKPTESEDKFYYVVKTGDEKLPTLDVPKRFVLTY